MGGAAACTEMHEHVQNLTVEIKEEKGWTERKNKEGSEIMGMGWKESA